MTTSRGSVKAHKSSNVLENWRQFSPSVGEFWLTIAIYTRGLSVVQSRPLVSVQGRIGVQTFGHFVTNYVHKAFKHSLKKGKKLKVT